MRQYAEKHKMPEILYDGTNSSKKNVWKSLEKMFKKPVLNLDKVAWKRAIELTYRQLRVALEVGTQRVPKITPDSTAGLWWKHFGFKTKAEVVASPTFWKSYEECVRGVRPFPPYAVSGKREPMHKIDLADNKIRTFLIESLELLIENKFLYGEQDDMLKALQPGYVRYGISFHEGGFDRLIRDSYRHFWLMFDVSGWDRQLAILDDVMDLRERGLRASLGEAYDNEFHARVRRARNAYVNHCILLPNGDVVEFDWGQVSGSALTTSNNCIAHNIIVNYLMIRACPTATDDEIVSQGGNVYGDDLLGSFDEKFLRMRDENFVTEVYKEVGLTIKKGSLQSSSSPEGLSFLGGTCAVIKIDSKKYFVPVYRKERVMSGLQISMEPLGPDDELMKAFSILELGWYDCYDQISGYIRYLLHEIPDSPVKRGFLRTGIPSRDQLAAAWAGLMRDR